jgi:dolichol-phosphate mannosyltransferase
MKLTVVIPAHNEEGAIVSTVSLLARTLREQKIVHEILVVNDHSTDGTGVALRALARRISTLTIVNNEGRRGFGSAVRAGLANVSGDAVAVFMADASDSPKDLVKFFRVLEASPEIDCVFGSRFMPGSQVIDYPWFKLMLNRMANWFIQVLFGLPYNDTTNAFKMYRREVIEGIAPLFSLHFNLTVELPLKAIVRGYRYQIVPNTWTQRRKGMSKLKIREMGSRYLFVVLYCLLEKWLSRGDYFRVENQVAETSRGRSGRTRARRRAGGGRRT